LDYNKALGNMTAFYKSALGGGSSSGEVQIPLPLSEKPRVRPDELTDVEIEQAIVPLFDYFDANLQTLNTYLSETAKVMVMSRVWKEVLSVIESLLIPPLSEVSSEMKPLSEKEVDIVFKWLKVRVSNVLRRPSPLMVVLLSSCGTIFMPAERDLCRLNLFRIRGTVMSCQFGCTMIGIRESFFHCLALLILKLEQGRVNGRMCQDDAAKPWRGLDFCQETRQECVFSTEPWYD
jgi:hypothetical protein